MSTAFAPSRTQMILGLCVPLAVLIGFFLAEPLQLGSLTVLSLVIAVLSFPILARWHHPLLVFSWNSAIAPVFIPGAPHLWLLLTLVSLTFAVLGRSLSQNRPLHHVPSVTRPLLVLMAVVVGTAFLTGGFGVRSLGSETYGGRRYIYIIGGILGYFALGSLRLSPRKRMVYLGLFFLSGLTWLIPHIAYAVGKSMYWTFYIFSAGGMKEQFTSEYRLDSLFTRLNGFSPASLALYCWLLARFGLKGVLDLQKPWRLGLFVLAWAACLYSGFRSTMVLFGFIFIFQFFFERLYRTRLLPALAGAGVLSIVLLVVCADRMPATIQRSLSILPIKVDPVIRAQADGTTTWRLEMWQALLPQVPRYLWMGKGFTITPGDIDMAMESTARGYAAKYSKASTVGDYHNGPLSVIIPLGIWGVFVFAWFIGASVLYLYRNLRNGDPALRSTNTLLLSLFLAKAVFFLLIFGGFYKDLAIFTGIVGFAACLNGVPARVRGKRTPKLEERTSVKEQAVSDLNSETVIK